MKKFLISSHSCLLTFIPSLLPTFNMKEVIKLFDADGDNGSHFTTSV